MLNVINIPEQIIQPGQNVLFSDTRIKTACKRIKHDDGSGLFTFREDGLYNVFFQAVLVATTAAELAQLAIKVDGETVQSAVASQTLTAIGDNASVSLFVPIKMCCDGCCARVAIENIGAAALTVKNASLTIERIG